MATIGEKLSMKDSNNFSKVIQIIKVLLVIMLTLKLMATVMSFINSDWHETSYPFSIASVLFIFAVSYAVPNKAIIVLLLSLLLIAILWILSYFTFILSKRKLAVFAAITIAILSVLDAIFLAWSYIIAMYSYGKILGIIVNFIIILMVFLYCFLKQKQNIEMKVNNNEYMK